MIGNLKPIIFTLLLTTIFGWSFAQSNEALDKADSLFKEQKYTEAFDIYSDVFSAGNMTESMLVKMAFIKEGLGDNVQALYYLEQYYGVTSDKSVLLKMQELATAGGLNGYEVADKDFMLNFLSLYRLEIQIGLVLVSAFLLAFAYQSRKKKRMPVGIPILQIIILVSFLVISNDWLGKDTAIIQSSTLLMSGPSAGAEPVGWVNEGHRIEVLDESDVWTKIQWKEGEAFIRKSKLK